MAAGLGTRLRPFTEQFPKALLPVLGVPVAQFTLDLLNQAEIQKIVVNIHHCSEIVKKGLKTLHLGNAKILLSDESKFLMGSAGGVKKAAPLLGNRPFFLINADVLFAVNLKALMKRHEELRQKHGVSLTLALLPAPPNSSQYREMILDSKQERVVKLGLVTSGKFFYSGVAVLEADILQVLPEGMPSDFVKDLLLPAIQNKKAGTWITEDPWFDIGTPQLWQQTHLALIEQINRQTIPVIWKNRIAQVTACVENGIYCEKGYVKRIKNLKWQSPSYWGPWGLAIDPPAQLGKNTILYGNISKSKGQSELFSNGIGFNNYWVKI